MWNLYARRGTGFSFCIPIDHGMRWSEGAPYGWFWRCHYGEGSLGTFCNRALAKSVDLLDRTTKERAEARYENECNPTGEGSGISDFATEYLNRIAPFAAAFKPAVWSDEQEWRWVFIQPPDTPPAYLELSLNDNSDQSAIAAICAGPHCGEEAINRVRQALCAVGIAGCPIYRSAVSLG